MLLGSSGLLEECTIPEQSGRAALRLRWSAAAECAMYLRKVSAARQLVSCLVVLWATSVDTKVNRKGVDEI